MRERPKQTFKEKAISRQYFIPSVTGHLDFKVFFFIKDHKGVTLFYASPYRERKKNRYAVTQFGRREAAKGEGAVVRFVGPRC